MGLAIAVELEDGHLVNHILGDDGKTLLRDGELLQELVQELGCQPLEAFWYHGEVDLPEGFDGDPDWLADLVEEQGLPSLWFDAAKGLACIAVLQEGLDATTEPGLDRALDALAKALEVGRERGTRFHLAFAH